MPTILVACLVIACASANAFAEGGLRPSAPAEVDRPFRALFATEVSAVDGHLDTAPADLFAETVRTGRAGALSGPPNVSAGAMGIGDPSAPSSSPPGGPSIAWGPLLTQSFSLLAFQHWFRATFEDGTWEATVEGPFWEDYVNSVKGLCCWNDGDKGTTNWLFHPMLGSGAVFLFANNHRDSQLTPPGNTRAYWGVKGKQMLFAFAYSTYFELGPVLSEAAIGNVGLDYSEQTWQDIIVTPTLGTAFSIGEDLLRVYVIDKVDRRNHFWGATLAIFLNPTRSFINLFALKVPWDGPEWLHRSREAPAKAK
jgi:hypothetical protein